MWKLSQIHDSTQLMNSFSASLYDQILPQLEEIFRNREEQLFYVIGAEAGEVSPYEIIEPSDDEINLGGMLSFVVSELSEIELVRWMERICEQVN